MRRNVLHALELHTNEDINISGSVWKYPGRRLIQLEFDVEMQSLRLGKYADSQKGRHYNHSWLHVLINYASSHRPTSKKH